MALTQILGKRPSPAAPEIHIAFGVDSNYVPAMGACMRSIVKNNENMRIQFHVITTSLPQSDVEQLAAFSEQNAITVQVHILGSERLSKLPEPKPPLSSAIYNRLLLCEILDGIASRVLYLDADIICLGSLADITSIPMDGTIVAAVADVFQFQDELKGNIGLTTDEPYFNSGVLYIDIEQWNRSHVTQNAIKTLVDSDGRFPFPDQDALNKILAGRSHLSTNDGIFSSITTNLIVIRYSCITRVTNLGKSGPTTSATHPSFPISLTHHGRAGRIIRR